MWSGLVWLKTGTGGVVTERNVSLVFSDDVGSGHRNALLKKERSGMFGNISFTIASVGSQNWFITQK
jgi:hypothetical protein